MIEYLLNQGELLLRIIIAGICGILIGYERTSRRKEAGIRTHAIVSLASALIMIISIYGFGGRNDPSRMAAQIVSGIGFLGAGMIFVHKRNVTGLTTAAGVWATSGVGMAIGAKLYFIGIAATIIILIFQIALHRNFFMNKFDRILLTVKEKSGALEEIQTLLKENGVSIEDIEVEKEKELVHIELTVCFTKKFGFASLAEYCCENKDIVSFSL